MGSKASPVLPVAATTTVRALCPEKTGPPTKIELEIDAGDFVALEGPPAAERHAAASSSATRPSEAPAWLFDDRDLATLGDGVSRSCGFGRSASSFSMFNLTRRSELRLRRDASSLRAA